MANRIASSSSPQAAKREAGGNMGSKEKGAKSSPSSSSDMWWTAFALMLVQTYSNNKSKKYLSFFVGKCAFQTVFSRPPTSRPAFTRCPSRPGFAGTRPTLARWAPGTSTGHSSSMCTRPWGRCSLGRWGKERIDRLKRLVPTLF